MISLFANTVLLLADKIIFTCVRLFLFVWLYKLYAQSQGKARTLWVLIGCTFLCSIINGGAWSLKLINRLLDPTTVGLYSKITLCGLRLSWLANIAVCFASDLLFETLTVRKFKWTLRHKVFGGILLCFACCIVGVCILGFHRVDDAVRFPLERWLFVGQVWYILYSAIATIVATMGHLRDSKLPRIVRQQTKKLLAYMFVPWMLLNVVSYLPVLASPTFYSASFSRYFVIIFGDTLYFVMLYLCIRQIMSLRFLNIRKQVQASSVNYNFTGQFKGVLARLGSVISLNDIEVIAQSFFTQAFGLRGGDVSLYIRQREDVPEQGADDHYKTLPYLEDWLTNSAHDSLCNYLSTHRILIRDELEFDYFYDEDPQQHKLLDLLDAVDADIIVPIYERQSLVAYMVIARGARPDALFTNIEGNEMSIFATYLGSIVYLLGHRNLAELVRQERVWQDDLYGKQQEINHCKESVRTLLRANEQHLVGLIYYHNRKLVWMSDAARAMFNLEGAVSFETIPYAAELKKMAHEALQYRMERHKVLLGDNGATFFRCSAFPYKGPGARATIIISRFENADRFTIPFDRLRNVENWEYALYLETTESGKLINELIPGSTEVFLNFKIDLLKIALSKKAMLLQMPEDDLMAVVRIIHHISVRSQLHVYHLTKPERGGEAAHELFGAATIMGHGVQEGLLSKLNDVGTLYVRNVEFLSMETQQYLASCIETGMFQPLRSDNWRRCNVRIICSNLSNLELLTEQKRFSAQLYKMLRTTAIALPSLSQISRHEIAEFAHRIMEQAIASPEMRELLRLNTKEADALAARGSVSIHEFKEQVRYMLRSKSQRKNVDHVVQIDHLTTVEFSPEVRNAIKLGKKALKDERLMRLLWETFQSQSKIATLLNVNRSSVNRRCKEFNLISDESNL
jgi:hypothetical protein